MPSKATSPTRIVHVIMYGLKFQSRARERCYTTAPMKGSEPATERPTLRRTCSPIIILSQSYEHDIQPPGIRSDVCGSHRGSPQSDVVHPAEEAAASWPDHRNRERS